jgi:hypothetical protein
MKQLQDTYAIRYKRTLPLGNAILYITGKREFMFSYRAL